VPGRSGGEDYEGWGEEVAQQQLWIGAGHRPGESRVDGKYRYAKGVRAMGANAGDRERTSMREAVRARRDWLA
jgi:hypothetical protein